MAIGSHFGSLFGATSPDFGHWGPFCPKGAFLYIRGLFGDLWWCPLRPIFFCRFRWRLESILGHFLVPQAQILDIGALFVQKAFFLYIRFSLHTFWALQKGVETLRGRFTHWFPNGPKSVHRAPNEPRTSQCEAKKIIASI